MADHTGNNFVSALLAGASAGLCVDLALYPLDTIKTRLQSAEGFIKSGGLRRIYAGLGSVAVGSMPGAALFFTTYEAVKSSTKDVVDSRFVFTTHILAASFGETAACLVRVPCEVVKQRAMVHKHSSSLNVLKSTIKTEGMQGLYRGYLSTVIREVPFSMIQFPLWEYFKKVWAERQEAPLAAWQSAVCGAGSGGIAGCITTPLDVAKTRIMLAQHGTPLADGSITRALVHVYREKGPVGLYAGVLPRTVWIIVGGAIFLGVYDKAKTVVSNLLPLQGI